MQFVILLEGFKICWVLVEVMPDGSRNTTIGKLHLLMLVCLFLFVTLFGANRMTIVLFLR